MTPPAPFLIRDFRESDVAPANALTNYFIRETVTHWGYHEADDAEFAGYWRAGVAAGYPWLAAECDGRFAGYCKAALWRAREAYRRSAETGIYLDAAYRGRGLGKALYLALFERMAAAGFTQAVAALTPTNEVSVALHRSVGFRHVGTFTAVGWKFDQWHDASFWQRPLG